MAGRPGVAPVAASAPTPAPRPAPSPAAPPPAAHPHASDAGFERLVAEHQELSTRRTRLQVLHEQAVVRSKQCQAEAAKLGIASLEELQARIEEAQEEDQRVRQDFEARLKSERDLQEAVSQRLADLDNPA